MYVYNPDTLCQVGREGGSIVIEYKSIVSLMDIFTWIYKATLEMLGFLLANEGTETQ